MEKKSESTDRVGVTKKESWGKDGWGATMAWNGVDLGLRMYEKGLGWGVRADMEVGVGRKGGLGCRVGRKERLGWGWW